MSTGSKQQRGAALLMLLMIAGLLGAFFAMRTLGSASQQMQQITDTTAALTQAKEALIGYAASHTATTPINSPYLPCPDKTTIVGAGTANDGREDRAGNVCVVQEGNLPWVTLGITGTDSWGNRLRYSVTTALSNSVNGMTTSSGTLTVNDAAGVLLASSVPAVILSHGPNGYGATSSSGTALPLPPLANANETENTTLNSVFVSSPPVATGVVGGEFDDLTTWLDAATLQTRMHAAGKL